MSALAHAQADGPQDKSATASGNGKSGGGSGRVLDAIEKIGNKVPHPAIIFLLLCVVVIVLSAVLAAFDVHVTSETVKSVPYPATQVHEGGTEYPGTHLPPESTYTHRYETVVETTKVESLLSGDGVRFLFTSAAHNFNDFGVIAVILVIMVGVGLAEEAGLIAALIRRLVRISPPETLTAIIVFAGILSSIASDAGYLVLIPLGAVAFISAGRHPLAGIAAAFGGVSAAFSVNLLIAPIDGIMTEITNQAIRLVNPGQSLNLTANYYFAIGSTLFLTIVITFVTERIIEPRLGPWQPRDTPAVADSEEPSVDTAAEARGLRYAGLSLIALVVAVTLLAFIPGAPLRNPETGSLFEDSPFMDGLIVIIMIAFLVMGLAFGAGAKTLRGSAAAMDAITKTFAGLGGLIFLLLIIAQFISYFNYSNIATVVAVQLADQLESANIGAIWLLIAFILLTYVINLIIPGIIPKWAIFAPIFVPLFIRLGVAPQTVLAAYRVGDSPTNVVTPLMVYLPFIVLQCQKFRKQAGVGTVISLMLPYTVVVAVAWLLFFVAWYAIGIPMGPGAPVSQ
ncbi:AbgT family transporter [Kitasatospora sp. NBC_01300]|uniref:AbgT family transporter n=1 Tax=Kitasatospora sp. NBC_01300 TaxID=2903574 RepID=UPI002F90AFD5|nr:AbgT family transporter [Kitasatospora sp. NBC_01300]